MNQADARAGRRSRAGATGDGVLVVDDIVKRFETPEGR